MNAHISRYMLHLAAIFQLGYPLYYDVSYVELPTLAVELHLVPPVTGKLKYLTFLVGLLQLGYYLLALGCDLLPLRGTFLPRLRDYLLASLVLPLALTVSVSFWALCSINRAVICPDFLQRVYPRWPSQTMHTCVAVYALLELCLTMRQYPQRSAGLAGLIAVLICYLVWLHVVWHWSAGIWVYPFLNALDGPLRLCFFALVMGLACGYYLAGERVNCVLRACPRDNRR